MTGCHQCGGPHRASESPKCAERERVYKRAYNQRPDVQEKRRAYYQRPDVKERLRARERKQRRQRGFKPRCLPKPNFGLPVEDARLAAWVIASEGNISILSLGPTVAPHAVVGVANTSLDFLEKFQSIIRVGRICQGRPAKPLNNQKALWHLHVWRKLEVAWLLQQIMPHLPIKKQQAELVMQYCLESADQVRSRSWHLEYKSRLNELNSKGVSRAPEVRRPT